jgi:hypothetical protein
MHKDSHVSNGIRTQDSSAQAGVDSSRLRLRGTVIAIRKLLDSCSNDLNQYRLNEDVIERTE